MTTKKLKKFFEDNNFSVYLFKQDGKQCAEIESFTDGGVDMIITLQTFIKEEFFDYVDDFDVDELIDLHRQDKSYRANFTISQSLKDFTDFHNNLKEIVSKLEKQK